MLHRLGLLSVFRLFVLRTVVLFYFMQLFLGLKRKGGIVSGCLDVQLTGKVIGIIETCLLNNFLSLKVYTLSDWRGNNLRGRSSK